MLYILQLDVLVHIR